MIFVMLIMKNSHLRTLPPSLVGCDNNIGCDNDIYGRCEIDRDNNSHLRTLPPSLVGSNNDVGCDKKSSVLRWWNHVVCFVPHLGGGEVDKNNL